MGLFQAVSTTSRHLRTSKPLPVSNSWFPLSLRRNELTTFKGILLLEVGCWKRLEAIDIKEKDLKDPERLRMLLLGSILDRSAHLAGTQFSSAVRFCLEKRQWSELEEWQVQKMMRQRVLEPLRACCS